MRQISARKFRDSFGTLEEPVTVLRRDPDGSFEALGTWTPGKSHIVTADEARAYNLGRIHAASGHDHPWQECPDLADRREEWAAAGLPE